MAIKSGSKGFMTFSILVFAIPTPTNKTEPTGGVHNPIQRFRTMIIPNCTGSIPIDFITGKKMGVKIKTAGVISINIPTNNRIKLISKRMMILLSLILSR
jgi:hypothetical protein